MTTMTTTTTTRSTRSSYDNRRPPGYHHRPVGEAIDYHASSVPPRPAVVVAGAVHSVAVVAAYDRVFDRHPSPPVVAAPANYVGCPRSLSNHPRRPSPLLLPPRGPPASPERRNSLHPTLSPRYNYRVRNSHRRDDDCPLVPSGPIPTPRHHRRHRRRRRRRRRRYIHPPHRGIRPPPRDDVDAEVAVVVARVSASSPHARPRSPVSHPRRWRTTRRMRPSFPPLPSHSSSSSSSSPCRRRRRHRRRNPSSRSSSFSSSFSSMSTTIPSSHPRTTITMPTRPP